jgi:hypothetical protein
LVGRWELDKNGTYPRDSVEKIEFLSDGTGSMDGMKIEWKAEKGRVMISAFGQAQTQNYKISGSKVIFCDDDGGNEAYYNRVKK